MNGKHKMIFRKRALIGGVSLHFYRESLPCWIIRKFHLELRRRSLPCQLQTLGLAAWKCIENTYMRKDESYYKSIHTRLVGVSLNCLFYSNSDKDLQTQVPSAGHKRACGKLRISGWGFPRHRSTAGQLPDCRPDQYRGLPKEWISWKHTLGCIARFQAYIPAGTSFLSDLLRNQARVTPVDNNSHEMTMPSPAAPRRSGHAGRIFGTASFRVSQNVQRLEILFFVSNSGIVDQRRQNA